MRVSESCSTPPTPGIGAHCYGQTLATTPVTGPPGSQRGLPHGSAHRPAGPRPGLPRQGLPSQRPGNPRCTGWSLLECELGTSRALRELALPPAFFIPAPPPAARRSGHGHDTHDLGTQSKRSLLPAGCGCRRRARTHRRSEALRPEEEGRAARRLPRPARRPARGCWRVQGSATDPEGPPGPARAGWGRGTRGAEKGRARGGGNRGGQASPASAGPGPCNRSAAPPGAGSGARGNGPAGGFRAAAPGGGGRAARRPPGRDPLRTPAGAAVGAPRAFANFPAPAALRLSVSGRPSSEKTPRARGAATLRAGPDSPAQRAPAAPAPLPRPQLPPRPATRDPRPPQRHSPTTDARPYQERAGGRSGRRLAGAAASGALKSSPGSVRAVVWSLQAAPRRPPAGGPSGRLRSREPGPWAPRQRLPLPGALPSAGPSER
ncbi:collagen alpha-1(I) chain-like [Neovison vison]|uniref:collagen alpha-1(I) chain-like n=1 Tax=Neovison vison TaxID=452646 RepID=UPI001CEFC5C6|nr:collagen alpha-1(I) chain-like [Neogale vison]